MSACPSCAALLDVGVAVSLVVVGVVVGGGVFFFSFLSFFCFY